MDGMRGDPETEKKRRSFAPVLRRLDESKVKHWVGLPPEIDPATNRSLMPWPCVLLIEEGADGTAMLSRHAEDGAFCGDTWHVSAEDALAQVAFEYPDCLGPWVDIPDDVENPVVYSLAKLLEAKRRSKA